MNFHRDLVDIVRSYFLEKGISYDEADKVEDLAARYCEMRIRNIVPVPRQVHFSKEIHRTLGDLANGTEGQGDRVAWNTVFRLRLLFTNGEDLTPYLSKNIKDASSTDGLLWDYGMHHFHLGSAVEESGFIQRSDYLLFAIVSDHDAFFVDVRKHSDRHNLQWVRQDLLKTVDANWPELSNYHALRGIHGSTLTDEEKKELRRKNIISVVALNGKAIAPLGWGSMLDGSSAWCRAWADLLLTEMEWHEETLKGPVIEPIAAVTEKIKPASHSMAYRLVLLDSIDASPECAEQLLQGDHLTKGLYAKGFAIEEVTSGHPVTITRATEK